MNGNHKPKILKYILLPFIAFNLLGIFVFGTYYFLSFRGIKLPAFINQSSLGFFLYAFIGIAEWYFLFSVIGDLKKSKITLKSILYPAEKTKPDYASSLVLFLSVNILFAVYMLQFGSQGNWIREIQHWQKYFIILFVPLTAGICEEIIWRGYLISMLKTRGLNDVLVIFISAVSFASIHGIYIIDKLIITFFIGLLTAIYYIKQRRLIPVIITHIVMDLWSFGIYLIK